MLLVRITLSGGFISDGGTVAFGFIALFGFALGVAFTLGALSLVAAALALGELALDFLDRFGLGRVLHHRDLARQAVYLRVIALEIRLGLLRTHTRAGTHAHDLPELDS